MNTLNHPMRISKLKAYTIFFLAASFYLYEYVLQVAPSVMAESMMRSFHVSAAGFGVIAAFYFYAYAPTQLPAGLLYDRYGPRRLMTGALLLCALGSFFFASTDNLLAASLGRLLIGVGSAFSFIGVLVLAARWFPARQFAVLAGIAQLMSSLGAMFGEMPLAALINALGWRGASFILAFIGVLLAILMWSIIRDYPDKAIQTADKSSLKLEWKRLIQVCQHSYTWLTGLYSCAIWTPIAVFAALWGILYLQQKYQISVMMASSLCSMVWIGIGMGSPLLGWLSDRCNNRRLFLAISASLGLFATIFILYVPDVSISWMYVLLFILGLGAGGQALSFAVVKDNNPPELVGTASGFNNLCVLIGGAVFQPLVGVFLHHSEGWYTQSNVHIYTIDNYNKALLIMPCSFLISLLVTTFWLKESHPEHKDNKLNLTPFSRKAG